MTTTIRADKKPGNDDNAKFTIFQSLTPQQKSGKSKNNIQIISIDDTTDINVWSVNWEWEK